MAVIHSLDLARSVIVAAVGLLWILGLMLAGMLCARASAHHVERVNVDSTITPVVRNSNHSGISNAERTGASAVILRLDTPGGLSSAMDNIVGNNLNSAGPPNTPEER